MASMVSGVYPTASGVLHWDVELPDGLPTLFTEAAAAGYEVGSFVFDELPVQRATPMQTSPG